MLPPPTTTEQQHPAAELLARRRDRAIAIVLGVKERECDEFLTPEASRKLRKVVLDQFNDLFGFCADLLETGVPDSSVNIEYLDRLDALTAAVEELVVVDDA